MIKYPVPIHTAVLPHSQIVCAAFTDVVVKLSATLEDVLPTTLHTSPFLIHTYSDNPSILFTSMFFLIHRLYARHTLTWW